MTGITLYRAKPAFQRLLRPLVVRAARRGVLPDHLTLAAVHVSMAAGFLATVGLMGAGALLLVAPALYGVRLALNAMDGMLAREHGLGTARGAAINEIGDAVADLVAYLPFALLLPRQGPAIALVLTVSLVAELAAIAGGPPRSNAGPLGKSDRALGFGALAIALAVGGPQADLIAWSMVGLSLLTLANRTRRALR